MSSISTDAMFPFMLRVRKRHLCWLPLFSNRYPGPPNPLIEIQIKMDTIFWSILILILRHLDMPKSHQVRQQA